MPRQTSWPFRSMTSIVGTVLMSYVLLSRPLWSSIACREMERARDRARESERGKRNSKREGGREGGREGEPKRWRNIEKTERGDGDSGHLDSDRQERHRTRERERECVCVCVRARARARASERTSEKHRARDLKSFVRSRGQGSIVKMPHLILQLVVPHSKLFLCVMCVCARDVSALCIAWDVAQRLGAP